MSLNGLDDPQVREAHEAAVSEPGGWFLLKYASRDEVELLGRGNGGIVDMRNNIAQYEESSPLFGFLKYRRRNVIIKYLPDDCSRLIQARVTVHFNAVCEKFTPYNTTFSITNAKELKDTTLSAACSLHTASSSTSSSTSSLRRRRLMEIAEEEEEEQRASKRKSAVLEDGMEDESVPAETADNPRPSSPDTHPPVTLNADLAISPEHSKFAASSEPPDFMGAERPTSPTQSLDAGRRMSSQTARPELYSYATYTYGKPKVKLAPRPSLDVAGRPKTSTGNFRPIAQMPAGFKSYSKGSKRQKSDDEDLSEPPVDDDTADMTFAPTSIPLPGTSPISLLNDLSYRPGDLARPATSSGVSAKSPTMSTFSPSVKSSMTPEKARLMKAMQLREKKKKMSMQPTPASTPAPATDEQSDSNADAKPPPSAEEKSGETRESDAHPRLATLSEEEERRLSMAKLESVNGPDSSSALHPAEPSESIRSDSRPSSPLVLSSEPDQSTKASSLSESTDETIQESKDEVRPEDTKEGQGEEEDAVVPDVVVATTKEQGTSESVKALENKDEEDGGAVDAHSETSKENELPKRGGNEDEITMESPAPEVESTSAADDSALTESTEEDLDPQEDDELAPETVTAQAPPLAIPKSKFSTQDPTSPTTPTFDARMGIPPSNDDSQTTPPAPSINVDAEAESANSRLSQRRTIIAPIRTDLDKSRPHSRLSDDEELMDELQSATVEQAHSLFVSKSPVTPVFSTSPTKYAGEGGEGHDGQTMRPRGVVRTISNPVRSSFLAPGDVSQSSARSVSSGAAYLHKITQQQTSSQEKLAPKGSKLGSNISQRIKALEKLSSTTGKESPSRGTGPSSTFFSVRRPSTRDASRSPSMVDRANSMTRGSPPPTAVSESRDGSPELRVPRDRSGSMASRLSMFESPTIPSVNTMPRGRPESISVTARIIRDSSSQARKTQEQALKDPSEYNRLDLKASPLEVNHLRGNSSSPPTGAEPPTKETIRERRMSKEKRRSQSQDPTNGQDDAKSRRSSLSVMRDFIKDRRKSLSMSSTDILAAPAAISPSPSPSRPPSTHHNNSISRRLSISSRRSSIASRDGAGGGTMSPSMFTEGSGSGDDSRSMSSDKKKSRAGRFMRRLSSSFTSSRNKNLTPTAISPTVQEEDLPEVPVEVPARSSNRPQAQKHTQQPSVVAYMGDVNVQFPDNLLWKRRTMCLDSQGFLMLSATTAGPKDKPTGAGVKRYHLSDFRKPYTPDVELQELPNSVVLDLVDGSGLQIACEDRAGQLNVLHILQDAHTNHSSFGQ